MKFVYNDGGRAEAGYIGDTRDCVCRAIATRRNARTKRFTTL